LRDVAADGQILLYRVPYGTMCRWIKDDDDVQRVVGKRGVRA
jgi:hypothetical protein